MKSVDEKQEKLTAIFWSFLKIGAVMFGGGFTMLPLVENELVKRRNWCSDDELYDVFALSQIIPGVVAVNAAMLFGHRLRGTCGAFASALGIVTVPVIVVLAYAAAFDYFRDAPLLQDATSGLRPAVAGLMLGVSYTLFKNAQQTRLGLIVSLTAAVLVLGFRVHATTVILCGLACGILWHLLARRKPQNGGTAR